MTFVGVWCLASVRSQQPVSASAFPMLSASFGSAWYVQFREISRSKLAVPEGMFCLMPKRTLIPIHFQVGKVGWFKSI